ncbi:ATP-binding protein [Streptosporangium sp. NPDC000239]|uniref:ATP-binding protein n=1 Tax=Streptosporangium sp. NPDC000239 TaxID=3154248 RepID=UPI003316A240
MKTLGMLGQVALPGEISSVPAARRHVRELLDSVGHTDNDDALLLVTEIVSNAVRHSRSGRPGGRVTVSVAAHDGTIHIDVTDGGSADRHPRLCSKVDTDSGGGRGLWLVQEIASAWGWHEIPAGRVVWFRLVPAGSAASCGFRPTGG